MSVGHPVNRDEEVMRGAATTGEQWIFFAYKRGKQGSCYARTEVCYLEEDLSNLDLILGVLIDWACSGINQRSIC